MAATRSWWLRLCALLGSLLGGLFAAADARAVGLPEDVAEAMAHLFQDGGVTASGPALLVRKSIADKVSLTGTYYADFVSNASIDVVTTASPFRESRNAFGLGANYAVRDTLLTVVAATRREPHYTADALNVDLAQDVFGGMTTISLGFTRGADKVYRTGDASFSETADHWRYQLGEPNVVRIEGTDDSLGHRGSSRERNARRNAEHFPLGLASHGRTTLCVPCPQASPTYAPGVGAQSLGAPAGTLRVWQCPPAPVR